jgi:hypothetical protein
MPAEGRGLGSRQTQDVGKDRRLGNLFTPITVQRLQTALHAKAKAEPGFRFYALYDKQVEAYGVERWLGELAQALPCGCAGGCARNTKYAGVGCSPIPPSISTRPWVSSVYRSGSATCRGRRREVLSESPVPEIGTPGSMRGMWKRGHDLASEAPPDERGGNR